MTSFDPKAEARLACILLNDEDHGEDAPLCSCADFEAALAKAWAAGRDAAADACLVQRCERGNAWDLAITTCADAIRALKVPGGE